MSPASTSSLNSSQGQVLRIEALKQAKCQASNAQTKSGDS